MMEDKYSKYSVKIEETVTNLKNLNHCSFRSKTGLLHVLFTMDTGSKLPP